MPSGDQRYAEEYADDAKGSGLKVLAKNLLENSVGIHGHSAAGSYLWPRLQPDPSPLAGFT
jgi:hypothetical protein